MNGEECHIRKPGVCLLRYGCIALALILSLKMKSVAAISVGSCDNTGMGHLTAPSLSPGHILRPSSLFMYPDPSPKGTLNITADVHWCNVWAYEPDRYLIDGEWSRWNTRVCYTFEDALSVGVLIPVTGRSGGFADPLIEGFHNAFHLGNASRDEFPQNESHIWTTGSGTTQTLARGDAWGLGDLAVFAVLHHPGTRATPSVTVCGQVSFPTGDAEELLGLGDVSASISVLASKRLWTGPVIMFAGLGFSYCPSDEVGALQLREEEYSGLDHQFRLE